MRSAEYTTKNNQSGFTLIEIIITLVVLSIAVVGILSVFATGTREGADPLVLNQAIALAQERMDTIMGDRMNPARGYTWITSAVSPYPAENPVAGFAAFNRNVTIFCVNTGALNTNIGAPPCALGHAHVTVTVTNTVVGNVNLDTVVTNY